MKKIQLFIIAFLLMIPSLAFAADGDSAAYVIASHALEIVAAVVTLLATWLTHKVSGWLKAKTGVETDALLQGFAQKGVDYAEEKAHQFLATKNEAMKGPEKLEMALGFALALAEDNKLPAKAQAKLVSYIEARLGATR